MRGRSFLALDWFGQAAGRFACGVESCHESAPGCRCRSAEHGRRPERRVAAIPRTECQRCCGAWGCASAGVRTVEALALEAADAIGTLFTGGVGRPGFPHGVRP